MKVDNFAIFPSLFLVFRKSSEKKVVQTLCDTQKELVGRKLRAQNFSPNLFFVVRYGPYTLGNYSYALDEPKTVSKKVVKVYLISDSLYQHLKKITAAGNNVVTTIDIPFSISIFILCPTIIIAFSLFFCSSICLFNPWFPSSKPMHVLHLYSFVQ